MIAFLLLLVGCSEPHEPSGFRLLGEYFDGTSSEKRVLDQANQPEGGWYADQALSFHQAVHAFTWGTDAVLAPTYQRPADHNDLTVWKAESVGDKTRWTSIITIIEGLVVSSQTAAIP